MSATLLRLLLAMITLISSAHAVNGQSSPKRIDSLIEICFKFVDADNNKALRYAVHASALSIQSADTPRFVRSKRISGQLLSRLDRTDESITTLTSVLPLAERSRLQEEQARILNALASVYTLRADYYQSLKYNYRSLALREITGDNASMSIAYNNIGLAYFKLENYEAALQSYEKALACKRQAHDDFDLGPLLVNMSLCYSQMAKPDQARRALDSAALIYSAGTDTVSLIALHFARGMRARSMNATDSALFFFRRSFQLAEKTGDKRFRLESMKMIAEVDIGKGKEAEALGILNEAETLVRNTGYQEIMADISLAKARLLSENKDYEGATDAYQTYLSLTENIMRKRANEMVKIQTEFSQRENAKIIQSQKEILELRERAITDSRRLIMLIAFSTILLFIISAILYANNVRKKRITVLLDQKVRERTKALAENYAGLKLEQGQRERFYTGVLKEVSANMNSIKGLMGVVQLEDDHQSSIKETIPKCVGVLDRSMSLIREAMGVKVS